MSKIAELKHIPDVSFIGGKTVDDVKNEMLSDYAEKLKALTGEGVVNDKYKLMILTAADMIYQAMTYIDDCGKMNLLKFSRGEWLENLAAFKGIRRSEGTAAYTTLRFTISAKRTFAVSVPIGTRAATDEGVYFATVEYGEIAPGGEYVDVRADCINIGANGNGHIAGTISNIVDPLPYIASVSNTVISAGGSDVETDDELTERAYNAPSSWSVAGPNHAYEYWAKQFRADVDDVRVWSPEATKVNVAFVLDGGVLPNEKTLSEMEDYLNGDELRPLTDVVTAVAPTDTEYAINMSYTVKRSDSASAVAIQAAVTAAVEDYKTWQRKIGRDINPSELIRRCMDAGAKRVAITSPSFTAVDNDHIAKCAAAVVTYGGLEDE